MTSAATAAARTRTDRNRAVDLYRAAAMAVVAVGHWLGMVVIVHDGKLDGGNLLDYSPGYAWITWIAQVMPLFFFVGGFASATSLRSAQRDGMRPADWIATRLHRMIVPAAALVCFWVVAIAVGAALGGFGIAALGAAAAAIPLWFLANYTIDTALAPFTFRWFRTRPWTLIGSLAAIFTLAEAARLAGIPMVPQINWIIGWLGFQIAGFAWQDGRLPTGRRLWWLAAAFWSLAIAAVSLGPWPATMLHHGGLDHSPTHPPSVGLLLFGFAYSLTAAALAPRITRWLERSSRAWEMTIAANVIAMSVYLWHMTAAVAVAAIAYAAGLIPDDEPRRPRLPRRAGGTDRAAGAPLRAVTLASGDGLDPRDLGSAVDQHQGLVELPTECRDRRAHRHRAALAPLAQPPRVMQEPTSHVGCCINLEIRSVRYSTRRPLIARAITSCWICSVPSKMS